MTDKRRLAVTISVLLIMMVVSAAIYNAYKDRIDPSTGKLTRASQLKNQVPVTSTAPETLDALASKASDFTMKDAEGNDILLSSFEGKPVVLNFWTSWCSHCKAEMPRFEEAYKQYGDQVQFIMLNAVKSEKKEEDGKNYIQNSEFTFPVFYDMDGKAIPLYNIRGFPATMFIDKDGKIVERSLGELTQEKLDENIQKILPTE
ncbi:TlpA family protein disulfide reductase [Oscillospiraceae bacterium LTW-04]|nr:TlpA disulfide reductase family protein [Oscillospiraceae bacterium MB24-C1]